MTSGPPRDFWSDYFDRREQNAAVRPLLTRVLKLRQESGLAPGSALELGCGEGTETITLLEHGWRVHAVDASADGIARTRKRAEAAGVEEKLSTTCSRFEDLDDIGQFDLVFASLSLQFAGAAFAAAWANARRALAPGGWLAVHLWGERHDWNTDQNSHIAFHSRAEVDQMLSGLSVLSVEEPDFDGPDLSGREGHWHGFLVVATA